MAMPLTRSAISTQREGFRRYLEGLLLIDEHNKRLTALANTKPIVGAHGKEAQSSQWFLTESGWNLRRPWIREILPEKSATSYWRSSPQPTARRLQESWADKRLCRAPV